MKAVKMLALTMVGGAALVGAAAVQPAHAAGCVSGAVAGGVVGHVAGHHGVLGAAAGCAIGHHQAKKNAQAKQEQAAQMQQDRYQYQPQR